MVVVTDHSRNFPGTVFVLPKMDKPSFAHSLCVVMPRVVEAVHTHLDRARARHVVDRQSAGNEFSGHLAANICRYTIGQFLFAECYATLIVIKLDIVGDERCEFLQITTVVSI